MIYLIVCYKTNTCKIGCSDSPEVRLIEIQIGNPFLLELLTTIEGTVTDEKIIHSLFKEYRLSGEWFRYCDEIRSFFKVENLNIENEELIKKIITLLDNKILYNDITLQKYLKIESEAVYKKLMKRLIKNGLIFQITGIFHGEMQTFYISPPNLYSKDESQEKL